MSVSLVPPPPQGVVMTAAHQVGAAVAGLADLDLTDPNVLSGSEAVELLTALGPIQARLDAVTLSATQMVRDSGVWGLDGSRSVKAFLEKSTGASSAKTSTALKLAQRLSTILPGTAQALRDGTISAEHALVLSRGACGTPARVAALADAESGEGFLLERAYMRVDQFKRVVARWAYHVDPDAEDAKRLAADDGFYFDLAPTLDGTHMNGFVTPEVGEALAVALDAAGGIPSKDDTRTPGRRRHDALATMAQLSLTSGGLGVSNGVRPQVMVHVDWNTLIGLPGMKGLDPAVLQETRSQIPRSVLDRLMCDSEVSRAVFGPKSQILDLGRSARTFTGPRRQALDARDGGCRAPGCDAPPRFCEGHHRVAWARGGRTDGKDGYLLCWSHHDWVHTHGIRAEHTLDGGLRFLGRDGRDHGTTYPRRLALPE